MRFALLTTFVANGMSTVANKRLRQEFESYTDPTHETIQSIGDDSVDITLVEQRIESISRGELLRATESHVLYSVEGSPELRLGYWLDSPEASLHTGELILEFSKRAAVFGLAHRPIGKGDAFLLPSDPTVKGGEFTLSSFTRDTCRASKWSVIPILFQMEGLSWTPEKVRNKLQEYNDYNLLMVFAGELIMSLKSLHQDAKLVHGCIGPSTVQFNTGAKVLFGPSARAFLISGDDVQPLKREGICPSGIPREFISPFHSDGHQSAQAAKLDDLWAALTMINWMGCPDSRFGIPDTVTDPDSERTHKLELMGNSWECEINGIQNPALREALGTLRRDMWEALHRAAPYDSIRALIRQSRDLLEIALQPEEDDTVFI